MHWYLQRWSLLHEEKTVFAIFYGGLRTVRAGTGVEPVQQRALCFLSIAIAMAFAYG